MGGDIWHIRTYKEGDEGQIVDLFNIAFSGALGFTFGRDVDEWSWRYKSVPSRIFVAEVNERIVGTVCEIFRSVDFCGRSFQCAMIDDVATHPDFRRRGIAKTLMKNALQHAINRGSAGIRLYAQKGSMPYKFYERLGFKEYTTVDYAFKILDLRAFRSMVPPKLKLVSYFVSLFSLRSRKPSRKPVKLVGVNEALSLLNAWSNKFPNYSRVTSWHLSRRKIIMGSLHHGSIVAIASITPRILVTPRGFKGSGLQLGDLQYREEAEIENLESAIMKCLELNQGVIVIAVSGDRMVSEALGRCGFFILRNFSAGMYLPISNDFKRCLDKAKAEVWFAPYENIIGEP